MIKTFIVSVELDDDEELYANDLRLAIMEGLMSMDIVLRGDRLKVVEKVEDGREVNR